MLHLTPEMANAWSGTSLPTLLSNYDLKDIYNADEFGLFYQCLPNKTDHLKSEKCYGGKLSKIHITGMTAAGAMDDKLLMFVIGKAKNPRCFKNVKFLPCRYRNQQKSWMDGKLFEEWLRELDSKFAFGQEISKNFIAARYANVSFSLGCTIDASDWELLSKV